MYNTPYIYNLVPLTLQTQPAPRNRSWKESESGLLLPEDHSMEYKKRELQNERKKEYQEHLAQVLTMCYRGYCV